LTDVAAPPLGEAGSEDDLYDDLHDDLLGALAALGGSAGNGRLRELLAWEEATYDAIKAELLNRGLILPGRGRGGSVALTDAERASAPASPLGVRPTQRSRAARGARGASASTASSFETTFRAIDDCLRKEAGSGTELDYTEQTSWLLFLKYLDGLEDDSAAMAALEGRTPARSWSRPTAGTAGRRRRTPTVSWRRMPGSGMTC
jgi:type I restriction enzyme M protein